MKDISSTVGVGPMEPDQKVTELRQKVNAAFLEAGLLEAKQFNGTDYIAVSDRLKDNGVTMVVEAHRREGEEAQMSISVRTSEREAYEQTVSEIQTAVEGAGIENVSWRQERPLVPSRAKAAAAAAAEESSITTPPAASVTIPELD
jgi:hypothetical protein